ncbi:SNAP receptor [Hypoxylon texense]
MPWFLLIPLLAAGINVVFRLPFDIYNQKIHQRRSKLGPILQAWSMRVTRDVKNEGVPPLLWKKEATKRFGRAKSRIFRGLGLQDWKTYGGFLGLPFWLIGIECVRQLCGGPRGIIGSATAGRPESAPIAPSIQEATEAAPAEIVSAPASHVSTVDPSTVSAVAEHAKYLPDPSIALEGCLWFPDLSVADPYHILPFALSAVLVANSLPKTSAGKRQLFGLNPERSAVQTAAPAWRLRLNRAAMLLGGVIGPLTMDLPAALHLYWLCSAVTRSVTNRALSYFMPVKLKLVNRCTSNQGPIIWPRPTTRPRTQKTTKQ